MTRSDATPWWRPEVHEGRRAALLARNRIQGAIRGWLAARDFIEVDPAALQVSPGNEAHLHGFATEAIGNDGQGRRMYLHTSPEFAMKKLLSAGETRIAAFAHVWRNRERGPLHSPEFTMLEWYRANEPYERLMDDCADILRLAADAAGTATLRYRNRLCDPCADAERLNVAEAFDRYASIDLMASIAADGSTDAAALRAAMTKARIRAAADDTWSDMFSRVLSEKIEPNLGQGRMTVLDHYPTAEAALARRVPGDARIAERFELYACGVELANGFENLRRCNCSLCSRRGAVMASVPVDKLRIVRGEDKLSLYQWNTMQAKHFFCSVCGIYTHHQRRSNPSEYGFNVACIIAVHVRAACTAHLLRPGLLLFYQ